jgi:hypothetical protein
MMYPDASNDKLKAAFRFAAERSSSAGNSNASEFLHDRQEAWTMRWATSQASVAQTDRETPQERNAG